MPKARGAGSLAGTVSPRDAMTGKGQILRFVGVAAVVVLAVYAVILDRAWHEYNIDGEIVNTYFPLAMALRDYERDNRSPAKEVRWLMPHYIAKIPSSRFADTVEYAVINDGKGWQISIHSRALSPPRVYLYRSTGKLSVEEEKRLVERDSHSEMTILRE